VKAPNIAYAIVQSLHNIGGALTLGFALLLLVLTLNQDMTKRILWGLLIVWGIQGLSGSLFALSSYYFYGALPDINYLAKTAMGIKVACVATAFSLSAWLIYKKQFEVSLNIKRVLVAIPIIAQVSAAVLRWSS